MTIGRVGSGSQIPPDDNTQVIARNIKTKIQNLHDDLSHNQDMMLIAQDIVQAMKEVQKAL